MSVPPFLVGAWVRSGLIVDGARVPDPCRVLWLQTPEWFADIRLPGSASPPGSGPAAGFARPWAFAGTAAWDPPVMTWDHRLDSMGEAILDSNPLQWEGDILIERGTVESGGRMVPFCEEWRPVSAAGAPCSVDAGARRIRVTIGPWRITVDDDRPAGPFRAARHDGIDGHWHLAGTVVDSAAR